MTSRYAAGFDDDTSNHTDGSQQQVRVPTPDFADDPKAWRHPAIPDEGNCGIPLINNGIPVTQTPCDCVTKMLSPCINRHFRAGNQCSQLEKDPEHARKFCHDERHRGERMDARPSRKKREQASKSNHVPELKEEIYAQLPGIESVVEDWVNRANWRSSQEDLENVRDLLTGLRAICNAQRAPMRGVDDDDDDSDFLLSMQQLEKDLLSLFGDEDVSRALYLLREEYGVE